MDVPVLLYGIKIWTTTRRQESRIQTSEMKRMRLDHIGNQDIRNGLGVCSMNVKRDMVRMSRKNAT